MKRNRTGIPPVGVEEFVLPRCLSPESRRSKQTSYEKKLDSALARAGIQSRSQYRVTLPRELREACNASAYVLDLLVERELDVEVDGPIHRLPEVKRRDRGRDSTLKKLGYRVMRIPNGVVAAHVDQAVDAIRRDLDLYRVE